MTATTSPGETGNVPGDPGHVAPTVPSQTPNRPLWSLGFGRRPTRVEAAAILLVIAGCVLRFVSTGALWLDESISNEIAKRPLGDLFSALRHDGSPPLYYLLLHAWIAVFGDSTFAVRSLSSVISLGALPLAWLVGKELGGRRLAGTMLLVTASTPYALRYATETRMYELIFVEVLLGTWIYVRVRRTPTRRWLIATTLITAALAYTHYWSFFLIGPVVALLLYRRQWRIVGAMAASVILFAPWLPSFFFQIRKTGTPWADPANLRIFSTSLTQWGGGGDFGSLLAVVMIPLAFMGATVLTRPARHRPLQLRIAGVPGVRALAAFAALPLVVVVVFSSVLHTGYAVRYTGVCVPFYLLLVARGLSVLPGPNLRTGVTGAVVVVGLVVGQQAATTPRTQAGPIAEALRASAQPGDVVAYCPDQLSPAVHRLLPASLGVTEIAYADPEGPSLVNWVDYAKRVEALPPASFAQDVLRTAGPTHSVWFVSQDGYRVFGSDCSQVSSVLASERGVPTIAVGSNGGVYEHATLARFPGTR